MSITTRISRIAGVALLAAAVSACAVPVRVAPGTGTWDTAAMSGRWCFNYGGEDLANQLVFQGSDTIVTQPIGRAGEPRNYVLVADNVYRDEGGTPTYEFRSPTQAVWRSNDDRQIAFNLNRC